MTKCKNFSYTHKNRALTIINALFLFLIIIAGWSCRKENNSILISQQNTSTLHQLNAVHFLDDNNGYAVGGETWSLGVLLQTSDGGQTWAADSLGGKQIFGLHFDNENKGYCTGIDGNVFKMDEGNDWQFHRFARWEMMRDIAFFDSNNGLTVGGQAYKTGIIQHINQQFEVDTFTLTDYELSAVCYSDAKTAHAVGYGVVLCSTDAGYTWELNTINGDFYQDVYFPTSLVGYAVGRSGTIIKSTDGGITWQELRNGDHLFVKDRAFRAVHFVDESQGYIVGDKGLFWTTDNGGEDWEVIHDLPSDIDFYDVFAIQNKGWIVGTAGTIFHFQK